MEDDLAIIRAKYISDSLNRVQTSIGKATNVIIELLEDETCPRGIRLNACKVILETALKAREQEQIIERIAILEQKIREEENMKNV